MAVSSFAQFPELGLDRGPRPKVKAVCVAGNAPHHGHIRVFPKICAAIKKAPPAGYSSHVPHNGDGALAGQPNKAPLIRSKRAIMPAGSLSKHALRDHIPKRQIAAPENYRCRKTARARSPISSDRFCMYDCAWNVFPRL